MERLPVRDRGIIAYDIVLWLKEKYGKEMLDKVIQRLSLEAAKMLSDPKTGDWYPVELMREVYDVLDEMFSKKEPRALESLGRFMADHGLRGFMRLAVSIMSVKTIVWRIGTLWSYYHEGGRADVPVIKDEGAHKEGVMTISGYDAGQGWCKLMGGYISFVVEATGAKDIKVEKKACISKGDPFCSWLVSWQE
jgi:predicted hydrocarbon binding protein